MNNSKWSEKNNKFIKRFKFNNFAESLEFVNKVGDLAEKAGHHPDIYFGWGYAEISLFSHDENKISDKDYDLAKQIDLLLP